jgi:DegV family protein with EDD domain
MQEQYNVCVIPMMIRCEDGEYRDGVDITIEEIYERLKTEIPKTSTPSGETIEAVFVDLKNQGYEKVLAVMVSSGISGTVNHVRLAAEDSGMEAYVIDSLSGSIGHGAVVLQAAIWREEGMEFDEICKKAEKLCKDTIVFFSIDTLEYLQKGGKVSGQRSKDSPGLSNLKRTTGQSDATASNKRICQERYPPCILPSKTELLFPT